MELSELTLRMLLLFFPGFICVLVLDTLTVNRRKSSGFFLIYAFVLGLASYLVLALVVQLTGWVAAIWDIGPWQLVFFQSLITPEPALPWAEILGASVVAIGLAFLLTAADTYKLLHRFSRWAKMSRKSGEPDVWNYVLNDPELDWVVVRDVSQDLVYEGYAEGWSYTIDHPAEIFLTDVEVYRHSTGERLYQVDGVYLSRKAERMTVEIPEYRGVESTQQGKGDFDE